MKKKVKKKISKGNHMQRKCVKLANIRQQQSKGELFHLQTSIDCLNRILNDQIHTQESILRNFRKNNPICFKICTAEGLVLFRLSAY